MKGLTSLTDSPFGIRILKRRPAWPGHEPARTQRLILAIIKINLPSTEAAARIDNLPSCAAKNFAHGRRWRFNDYAVTQAALARFCCRGKTRHETATAACWPRRKSKRISAVVANVIAPVHRCNYPAETERRKSRGYLRPCNPRFVTSAASNPRSNVKPDSMGV